MGVQMNNLATTSTDHETELASIARMLAYIRDSARALDAQALEYCVEMALQAVSNELRDRRELTVAGADFESRTRILQ
ncbi:hypothetical protein PYH37_004762 [Sinorhizobium numidicum]|uniref:Uncharacterized protein n=1 Tax=Sinorhizobium numidicum TaxID=680248 RepID=A0ABY8D0B4_9HYPH|nr:hypothetical protein [Sinorhizobium numidicum]WEX76456.1 hypothetical protein PYH37_004762 [Sinorhizobium numidicum]WEX83117.1 hypothetical protein PYH38_005474 [Sinorhizobium numidicum]